MMMMMRVMMMMMMLMMMVRYDHRPTAVELPCQGSALTYGHRSGVGDSRPQASGGRPRPRSRSARPSPRWARLPTRPPSAPAWHPRSSCPSRSRSTTRCKFKVIERDGPPLTRNCNELSASLPRRLGSPPRSPPTAVMSPACAALSPPGFCLPRSRLLLRRCSSSMLGRRS
jgi:hypothetical protein